jgi:hypothetical protein
MMATSYGCIRAGTAKAEIIETLAYRAFSLADRFRRSHRTIADVELDINEAECIASQLRSQVRGHH